MTEIQRRRDSEAKAREEAKAMQAEAKRREAEVLAQEEDEAVRRREAQLEQRDREEAEAMARQAEQKAGETKAAKALRERKEAEQKAASKKAAREAGVEKKTLEEGDVARSERARIRQRVEQLKAKGEQEKDRIEAENQRYQDPSSPPSPGSPENEVLNIAPKVALAMSQKGFSMATDAPASPEAWASTIKEKHLSPGIHVGEEDDSGSPTADKLLEMKECIGYVGEILKKRRQELEQEQSCESDMRQNLLKHVEEMRERNAKLQEKHEKIRQSSEDTMRPILTLALTPDCDDDRSRVNDCEVYGRQEIES